MAARVGSRGALDLRANFAWTASGNAVFALCQWGAVVVLARTIAPAAVGEWSLAFAVTTPAFMLADLQLRTVYATDVDERFELASYVALRVVATLLVCLGLLGFVALRSAQGLPVLTILGVSAAKAVESVSELLYGVFQKRERMDRIARSLLLRGVLALAALGSVVAASGSVPLGAAAFALSWLAVLLAHDVPTARQLAGGARPLLPRCEARALAGLFRLALPLGIVTGLVSLNFSIPRYFLDAYRGPAELGVFAAMAYCVLAGGLIVNALGQSLVVRLSRLYSSGDARGFRDLMIKLLAFGLGLGALASGAAYFAGSRILEMLYGREFTAEPMAFSIVVLGGSIGYMSSFLGYGMTAARFFRVQAPLFAALALLNGLTCLWLVPRMGLTGAALATVVTASAGLALSLAVNVRALRDLRGNP